MDAYEFTDAQTVDLRRYCGFPAMGTMYNRDILGLLANTYGQFEARIVTMTEAEATWVLQTLDRLKTLEDDIFDARDNLDTDRLAVIDRNPTEVFERERLYTRLRMQLCDHIGVGYGPNLKNQSGPRSFSV